MSMSGKDARFERFVVQRVNELCTLLSGAQVGENPVFSQSEIDAASDHYCAFLVERRGQHRPSDLADDMRAVVKWLWVRCRPKYADMPADDWKTEWLKTAQCFLWIEGRYQES